MDANCVTKGKAKKGPLHLGLQAEDVDLKAQNSSPLPKLKTTFPRMKAIFLATSSNSSPRAASNPTTPKVFSPADYCQFGDVDESITDGRQTSSSVWSGEDELSPVQRKFNSYTSAQPGALKWSFHMD